MLVALPLPAARAFENDRDMLEDHTPETAFIFSTIRKAPVVGPDRDCTPNADVTSGGQAGRLRLRRRGDVLIRGRERCGPPRNHRHTFSPRFF